MQEVLIYCSRPIEAFDIVCEQGYIKEKNSIINQDKIYTFNDNGQITNEIAVVDCGFSVAGRKFLVRIFSYKNKLGE